MRVQISRWTRMLALLLAAVSLPGQGLTAAPAGAQADPASNVSATAPAGVTVDGEDLIVAEAGKGRLLRAEPDGTTTALLDGLIPGIFTRGPTGVAVDADGNTYAAVAEDGAVLFVTPSGESGVYARGLGAPNGIAFDDGGTLYVADQAARRVLAVTPAREITTVAEGFDQPPFGLAFDPGGALHVSTQKDGKVWRIGVDGAPEEVAGTGGTAEGLAFDDGGNLYVGDGSRGEVLRFDGGVGSGTAVASGLAGPLNLAFAGTGLHVSTQGEGAGDTKNRVVRVEAGAAGLALAAPDLAPAPLPDAPDHTMVHRGGGAALDPAPFLDVLPEATATSVGLGAFEPTIGVSDTGAVFFNPKPTGGGTAGLNTQHIMRSRDHGLTWQDVSPRVAGQIIPPTDLDPYIYVDRDTGRLFTILLYVGCSWLAFSDDDGDTWTHNPAACGLPVNDHQTLYAGPTTTLPTVGYPNALYYCWNAIAYSGCGRSLDGGLSFHPTGTLPFTLANGCAGLHGHVSVGPDGTVYLPKGDCSTGPQVAISRDDGITWERIEVAGPGFRGPDHESHVATDTEGNAYFVWTGADRLPYLSVSTDAGATWSDPIMVGPPGLTTAWGPSVAAGDEGKVSIFYMGTTGDCCYSPRLEGESMWNAYSTTATDALADDPVFFTTPFNDPVDPLRRGTCGPGRCGGRPTSPGDFLEVFVDHTGRTWAAIVDTCRDACAEPGLTGSNNDELGMAGQIVTGPALIGDETLQPPPWWEGG